MNRAASIWWPARGAVAFGALAFGWGLALGCTVEPSSYTSDADVGNAHALVSIERSTPARAPEEGRAEAFAGFLQAPPEADPAAVLRLTGLSRDLPAEGQCATGRERDSSIALAPLSNVELVDVGNLSVTADGATTTLAPRAFPTVTDLVSGVVYTTRDRDAQQLLPARGYLVSASGGSLAPFTAQAQAPEELQGVTVLGSPLDELETLRSHAPIDLAWVAGESGDVVYVEVGGNGGQQALVCAFRDDAGGAVIPAGLLPRSGMGKLGVHRLRVVKFAREGLAHAEVRFDFETAAEVAFSD